MIAFNDDEAICCLYPQYSVARIKDTTEPKLGEANFYFIRIIIDLSKWASFFCLRIRMPNRASHSLPKKDKSHEKHFLA